jgi:hypothetical protein
MGNLGRLGVGPKQSLMINSLWCFGRKQNRKLNLSFLTSSAVALVSVFLVGKIDRS